jgi:hypothetical protein
MTARERLPNRRRCESFEFRHAGHPFTLTAGHDPDNRIGEIFISSTLAGSQVETIRAALTRGHDGDAASPLGAALDALPAEAQ